MPPASAGRHTAAPSAAQRHLIDLLTPVVAESGYDLEDVTVTSAGRRSLVRVIVDSDHGVDLDAVAEISRAVSDVLDGDSPGGAAFAGPFVLEVSSPGVDRKLTEQRHWRRAVGRLVQVTVAEKSVTGRVVETSEAGVTLEVAGKQHEHLWAHLGAGRVQVEFSRPGEPNQTEGD